MTSLITLDHIYYVSGIFLVIIALMSLRDKGNPRRVMTAAFWGLFAISFLFGDVIPSMYMGILVLIMVLIAGFGGVRHGKYEQKSREEREAKSKRLGNKLFIPALLIPLLTVIGTVFLDDFTIGGLYLMDPAKITLVSLGVASIIAVLVAMALTREGGLQPIRESRRLVDAIGWASVLPQMLATLGVLFTLAGVGDVIADLVGGSLPVENKFLVVLAYCLGMALFTMIMGNAFAAFPVITAGIGLPLLIDLHGGNPAVLAAIGMFSGYCGTLMTPMAANFNIVPAALLDLPDKNGVIKAQVPTALILLTVNVFLMYFLVF